MAFKTNRLATQTKIITQAISGSPFHLHDSMVRFKDFAALATYGDCKIEVTQTSMGNYKIIHLNDGWGQNKSYRPEAHFLPSLKARLAELAQVTDTLAAEAEAIKQHLVSLTGCEAGNIEITSPVSGRYGKEPRLVKISFTAPKGGPTKAELAEVCEGKLESAGILNSNRIKRGYGLVHVWSSEVK